jgi:hypothetical protein
MKKHLFFALAITTYSHFAQTFVEKDLSLTPGYAKEVFYNLDNNSQHSFDGDNWHLAFGTGGVSGTIRFNASRGNKLYSTTFTEDQWTTVDTAGISTWTPIYNDAANWKVGALNKGGSGSPVDFGWGTYDMATHFITGNKVYIAKLGDDFVKINISKLQSGTFHFKYQKMETGSTLQEKTVAKTDYSNAFFAYHNLLTNTTVNNEPAKNDWQLRFGKYIDLAPTPYGVTGVRTKPGVKVAQIDNTPVGNVDVNTVDFDSTANIIGYDWKKFNMGTFSFDLTEDLSYVVKTEDGKLYHMYFTYFKGSSTGEVKFKVAENNVSVDENNEEIETQWIALGNEQVALSSSVDINNVSIFDTSGRSVLTKNMNGQKDVVIQLPQSGVYFLQINVGEQNYQTVKIIL